MNNSNFDEALKVYGSTLNKIKKHMTKEMLIDEFFSEIVIRDILNLTHEEHKSLKEEIKIYNINYDDVIEKLLWVPDSEVFIKMQLENEFNKQ
ncbi:hypothetical protein IM156_11835 [Staphylococcus epidermidis]|nr:hypothetical protein [Staphylococcus epidermidis]